MYSVNSSLGVLPCQLVISFDWLPPLFKHAQELNGTETHISVGLRLLIFIHNITITAYYG